MKQSDMSTQVTRLLTLIERRLLEIAHALENLESDCALLKSEKSELERIIGEEPCSECGQPHKPLRTYRHVPRVYFASCLSAIKCAEDALSAYHAVGNGAGLLDLANLDSFIRQLKLPLDRIVNEENME